MNPLLAGLELHAQVCALGSFDVRPHRSACRPARCCTGTDATAPVVKLHEYGLLIGVPEAFCAPDTVAV